MFCVYVNGVVLNLVCNLSPLIALAIKHKVCLNHSIKDTAIMYKNSLTESFVSISINRSLLAYVIGVFKQIASLLL